MLPVAILFLVINAIWGDEIVNFLGRLFEDPNKPKLKDPHLTAKRNIPLQYAYTIDEWYRLRLEFDKLIEEDWELFRNDQMSPQDYKAKCKQAAQQIIGMEHWEHFRTLYEWGVRNAAIRIAEEGCAPGVITFMTLTNWDVATWHPTDYFTYGGKTQCDWKLCIPTKHHSFLTMVPNGYLLEGLGCGIYEGGKWLPQIDEGAKYTGIFYYGNAFGNKEERQRAIDYFVKRGFTGHKYEGEDRNFGDLTKAEIDKKYQFIIKDPCTGEIENSAYFIINKHGYNRKRFID